jgi:hypothetical protein
MRCHCRADAVPGHRGANNMTTWEYLIVSLPVFQAAKEMQGESASVALLNREGAEGWEAVGVSVLPDQTVAVLLKRPRG